MILKRICQLSLTRITHQVSRAFDLNCEKGKSEAEIQTDTDDFLSPLRHLFPPPTANSHAETACSDTLTEAGYARYGDENQPTVLSWILLSDLPNLLDGTDMHVWNAVPSCEWLIISLCK